MRAAAVLLVCLPCVLPGFADEAADPLERAVQAALAAHDAADGVEMARLAACDAPDPWRVANGLLSRGAVEAAATQPGD